MATVPRISEPGLERAALMPGWKGAEAVESRQTLEAELLAATRAFRSQGDVGRLLLALVQLQQQCQKDLDASNGKDGQRVSGSSLGDLVPLSQVMEDHVVQVYHAVGCNKTRAARVLEIDIKTLYNKLRRYGEK